MLELFAPDDNDPLSFSSLLQDSLVEIAEPVTSTPVLTDRCVIHDKRSAFHGWVELPPGTRVADSRLQEYPRLQHVLDAVAAAPMVHSVHVLRPQDARQYDGRAFPVTAPVVTGLWTPSGHTHPLMKNSVYDLVSYCFDKGKPVSPVVHWAVCMRVGGTRVWFYAFSVGNSHFDLVIQFGPCFCKMPAFCAKRLAELLGITL
jgi:hypothetical protein